jgi:hypothetical protein
MNTTGNDESVNQDNCHENRWTVHNSPTFKL